MKTSTFNPTKSAWKGAVAAFWSAVTLYGTLQTTCPDMLNKIGAKGIVPALVLGVLAAAWNWKKNHKQ